MKRIVKYISVDPYYSDFEETYIGSTAEEIDNIQSETENSISQYHYSLSAIYKTEVIYDDTVEKYFNEPQKENKEIEIIL